MAVQGNPKTSFEDYRGELSKVVPNLSGRRGMERLNRVRVNLMHYGSIPGTQQVADARTDVVEAFLAANAQAVFGVDCDTARWPTWCRRSRFEPRCELLRRRRRRPVTARRRWARSQRRSTSSRRLDSWNIRRSAQAVVPDGYARVGTTSSTASSSLRGRVAGGRGELRARSACKASHRRLWVRIRPRSGCAGVGGCVHARLARVIPVMG